MIGAVNAGTNKLALVTTGANHGLTLDAGLTGGTVDLASNGDVIQSSAGAVIASLLNVSANTGITLTSSLNDITTVGTDHTNTGSNTIDKH